MKGNKMRVPIRKSGLAKLGKFRVKRRTLFWSIPVFLLLFYVFDLWFFALAIFVLIIAVERARKKKMMNMPSEEKGGAQKLLDLVQEEEDRDTYAQKLLNTIDKEEKK